MLRDMSADNEKIPSQSEESWLQSWSIQDTARRVEIQLANWDLGVKQRTYIEKNLSFGQKFKMLRRAHGLDRKDIAESDNISAEAILCLEKGLLHPSEIELLLSRVAKTVNTTPNSLLRSFHGMYLDDGISE